AGVISECTPSTGPGTVHQSVNADETWTAAGSPHTLASDSTIYATLTIEPCAELLLAPGRTITVRGNGTIVARAPANPSPYLTGTIDVQGSDRSMPTQPLLEVDHVSIQGSGSNGVALYDGAGFAPGSAELTIGGSAQYPIGMWSRAVDGVPTGHYTGNAHDEIMLYGQGLAESIYENATLHERGVPYLVGHPAAAGTLYVGGASGATGVTTLTIEPGVSVRFK